MININLTGRFSKLLDHLPRIEELNERIKCIEIPEEVRTALFNRLDLLRKNIILMASLGNIADNLLRAFSKTAIVAIQQLVAMKQNVGLVTSGMISLLVAETKILNPKVEGEKKSKTDYMRIALKITGYTLLAFSVISTLKTISDSEKTLSKIGSLALNTTRQTKQLLSQI
jgi:hypothetical protein